MRLPRGQRRLATQLATVYFEAAVWDTDECPKTYMRKTCTSAKYYVREYVKRHYKHCSQIRDALGENCWMIPNVERAVATLRNLPNYTPTEKDDLLKKELKRITKELGEGFDFPNPWPRGATRRKELECVVEVPRRIRLVCRTSPTGTGLKRKRMVIDIFVAGLRLKLGATIDQEFEPNKRVVSLCTTI